MVGTFLVMRLRAQMKAREQLPPEATQDIGLHWPISTRGLTSITNNYRRFNSKEMCCSLQLGCFGQGISFFFTPAVVVMHFPGFVIWNFEHHGATYTALQ